MAKTAVKNVSEGNHIATQARWIYIALIFFVGAMTKISGIPNVMFPPLLMVVLSFIAVGNNCLGYLAVFFHKGNESAGEKILYRTTFFQYIVDIILVSAIIHFAGGIESISFIFYFFVIIASSFIYSRREIVLFSVLAACSYAAVIFLEYFKILRIYPRYNFSDLDVHFSLDAVVVNVFTVSGVILTAAFFISYLSRLRKMQEKRAIFEKEKRIREAKRSEEIKSRFLTVMTHQFRTPLTHIKMALSLLSDSKDINAEYDRKNISEALFSVERALEIINRLVKIKDLESGGGNLKKDKISLKGIAEEAVAAFFPLSQKKRIKFVSSKNKLSGCFIEGDKELLLILVEILLENAIMYGNSGSEVKISISKKENFWVFSVSNSGIGISPQDRKKIFSPFFRTSEALRKETNKSGLSLYLAKIIAEKHRGRIYFVSVPNKETTFFLQLPVH